MNNKGFLLIDALVNTLIVSLMCLLCLMIYTSLDNYDEGIDEYIDRTNEKYDLLYLGLKECEKCEIEEESDEECLET